MSVSHESGAPATPVAGQEALGRRRHRGVVIGAVALSLLAAGGVGAIAAQRMFGSGTSQDAQPATVLPIDALAYFRADSDPSTAQKVAAFRLFDKLPEAKKALGDGNPKKALFELITKDSRDLKDVDYAQEIEPWLGDRVGLAVLAPRNGGKEPMVVAALQVKDEAKAREGLERLLQKTGADFSKLTDAAKANAASGGLAMIGSIRGANGRDQDASYWYREGYMLLTRRSDEQAVRAAVDKGQLSNSQDFTRDMNDLGEQGVLSGWTDTPKLIEAMNQGDALPAGTSGLTGLAGRQAGAVRFDAGHVELASLTRDNGLNIAHPAIRDLGGLPSDTVGFASGTGGADLITALWPKMESLAKESNGDWDRQLKQFQEQTGIAVPGDLQTLLGKQFDIVVSEKSVKDQLPVLGLRMLTDSAKAEALLGNLDKLLRQGTSGGGATFGLHRRTDGDFTYVGSTKSYLDELVAGGKLADDATMREALPDLDKANGAIYVNLDKIESLYLNSVSSDQPRDLLSSLKAVGVTTVKNGDRHDGTIRVLVN